MNYIYIMYPDRGGTATRGTFRSQITLMLRRACCAPAGAILIEGYDNQDVTLLSTVTT